MPSSSTQPSNGRGTESPEDVVKFHNANIPDWEKSLQSGQTITDKTTPDDVNESFVRPLLPEDRDVSLYLSSVGEPEVLSPSGEFIKIMRNHFVPKMLSCLEGAEHHAQSPGASVYVDELLHLILEFDRRSPGDPSLAVLLALYDSLIVNNRWTEYSQAQLHAARALLEKYFRINVSNRDHIEKAILRLDEIGFDIMPFSLGD